VDLSNFLFLREKWKQHKHTTTQQYKSHRKVKYQLLLEHCFDSIIWNHIECLSWGQMRMLDNVVWMPFRVMVLSKCHSTVVHSPLFLNIRRVVEISQFVSRNQAFKNWLTFILTVILPLNNFLKHDFTVRFFLSWEELTFVQE